MEVKMHIIYHVWQLAETYFQLQLFMKYSYQYIEILHVITWRC